MTVVMSVTTAIDFVSIPVFWPILALFAVYSLALVNSPPGPASGFWPSLIPQLSFATVPPGVPFAFALRPSGPPHRRLALLATIAIVGMFHVG